MRQIHPFQRGKTFLRQAVGGCVCGLALWTLAPLAAHGASLYWDTVGGNGLGSIAGTWDAATTNWNSDPTGDNAVRVVWNPGDTAIFANNSANGTVTISSNQTIGGLQLSTAAGNVNLSGGANALLINTGTISNTTSRDHSINTQIQGNGLLTINMFPSGGTGIVRFLGVISDSGGARSVEFIGASGGRPLFGANNTYSGNTTVNGPEVVVGSNSNVGLTQGPFGTGTLILQSGTLRAASGGDRTVGNAASLDGNFTFGASSATNTLTFTGPMTLTGNRTLTFTNSTTTFNGVLGDGGNGFGFTKAGAATLVLGGANTYSGVTTISVGTLQIGGGGTTGTLGSGAVTNNGGLAFNRSNTYTVNNVISGTGNLAQNGSGTTQLTNANSYSGTTTVNFGTLNIQNNSALGTAAGGTTVASGASLQLQNNITVTGESLNITGQGSVDEGVLRNISGNNTWTGNITATGAGIGNYARIVSDSGLLTLTGNINVSGGTLILQGAGDGLVTGDITGGLPLLKSSLGGGTWTLAGTNNYTTTTISAGTLQIGNGGTTGTLGTGDVTNNSVLAFNRTDTYAVNNVISGSGSVTQQGAGTVQLNAANTYTGGTNVNAGTLALGANNVLANTGAVNVAGGTFDIASFNDTVGAVTLTSGNITGTTGVLTGSSYDVQAGTVSAILGGTANLTKTTGATVILSGANTYTGTTSVTGGVLNLQHNSALGGGSAASVVDATLQLQGGVTISGKTLTLGDGGATLQGNLVNVSGNNTWDGDINKGYVTRLKSNAGLLTINGKIIGSDNSLYLDGDGDGVLNGVIENAYAVQKEGTGTWTINSAGTYGASSATNVSAGTLLLNNPTGSALDNANVIVANTATLGGTGSFTGSLTVNSGGTLSPGMSPGTLAGGTLSMQTGSNYVVEIDGLTAGDGFGFYDQYIANGSVNLASGGGIGATLQVSLTTPLGAANDGAQFIIVDQLTTDAVTGTFAYDGASLLEGDSFVVDTWNRFTISYVGGTGNDVVLTYSAVVPEPSTVVLLGLGLVGVTVLAHRRRQRELGQRNG